MELTNIPAERTSDDRMLCEKTLRIQFASLGNSGTKPIDLCKHCNSGITCIAVIYGSNL